MFDEVEEPPNPCIPLVSRVHFSSDRESLAGRASDDEVG